MSMLRHSGFALIACALLMTLLPLLGTILSGQPLVELLRFPLNARAWDAVPANALISTVLIGTALLISGLVITVLLRLFWRRPASPSDSALDRQGVKPPWPRYTSLAGLIAIAAIIAIDGDANNAALGLITLALTLLANADTERRTGTSLLSERRGYFLRLYPISLLAGWILFYWLNLFGQCWFYPAATEAVPFALGKSLDYATLLPAMLSLRQWLAAFPRLLDATQSGPAVGFAHDASAPVDGWLFTAGAGLGLVALAVWPDQAFPMILIAPLLLLFGVQRLRGQPSCLIGLQRGDWSRPLLSTLAVVLLIALAQLLNQALGPIWSLQRPLTLPLWLSSIPLALTGLTLADQASSLIAKPPKPPRRAPRSPIQVPIANLLDPRRR
jgi:hypothetical protein